jgi:hypothetical protein
MNNAASIAPGTTLNFARGAGQNFGEVDAAGYNGTAALPIVVQTWRSGILPVFTATTDACFDIGGNDWWTIRDLRLTGGLQPGGNNTVGGGFYCAEAEGIVLEGLTIDSCFAAGILINGSDDVLIDNCTISNITTDGATRGDGITVRVHLPAENPSLRVTIQNCTISDCGRQLIFFDGINTGTVSGNAFSGSAVVNAIHFEPNPGHLATNVTITGNTFSMTTGNGVNMDGGEAGATVSNITVMRNTIDLDSQAGGRGVNAADCTNVTVRENLLTDCDVGVRFLRSTGEIKHNYWDDTAGTLGSSFGTEAGAGCTVDIFGNVLIRCRLGLWCPGGAGNTVQFNNNTIAAGRHRLIQTSGTPGLTAQNNCFHHAAAAGSDTMIYDLNGNGTYNYNLFYSDVVGDAGQFFWDGTWHTGAGALASWQAAPPAGSGQDANSIGSQDPLFNNAGADQYWPGTGSPLEDNGDTLASTYEEGLNNISVWPASVVLAIQGDEGTGWEIGAYVVEFESSSSSSCSSPSCSSQSSVSCSSISSQSSSSSPAVNVFPTGKTLTKTGPAGKSMSITGPAGKTSTVDGPYGKTLAIPG